MATGPLSFFFGLVVRARRVKLALTQEEIAGRAGVHPTYVGMIERAERNCSIDIAAAIATALGTSLGALVAEAEEKKLASKGQAQRKSRGK